MMRSLLGFPSYLPMIALALASGAHVVAQAANFTLSDFQSLYTAVESRGIDAPMPWHVASVLGMQVANALPCRQVRIGAQGAAVRTIVSFQYQSHQYLLLLLRSGTDHWLFLIDDAGNSTSHRMQSFAMVGIPSPPLKLSPLSLPKKPFGSNGSLTGRSLERMLNYR